MSHQSPKKFLNFPNVPNVFNMAIFEIHFQVWKQDKVTESSGWIVAMLSVSFDGHLCWVVGY